MWTDRFFGVQGSGSGTNASTTMMSAVDSAISESVGWLKGPHDTDLADNYYSESGVMPFKYCAARWTINETVLGSLYDSFSGWQKAALSDYDGMKRSAAALLWTAGQAITGTCAAGKQFTAWASVCINAGSKETCPGSLNSVSCQWDPTFGVCKPTSLTAGDSILDMGGDHWMSYLKSEWKSCASADNATACAAAGYSFTYDTGVLKSYSTLRTSWYYVDPPPPALPSSPPSTSPSPAPPSPPSPAPPRPPSPRPPSPSSASPSSASAVRLGWAAVLLQAVMFALAAPTGHH
ncbi:hypothetical protein PLESTM_000006400 [Pleodorina starrii]|nr:hypothetical protein PLESTM_000006400 [Pleodorina starrii]